MAERFDDAPDKLAGYFLDNKGLAGVEPAPQQHDHDTSTTVREFDYQSRRVRIETTYRIQIDGKPLLGHVEVLPSGNVHYHRFPQYAPSSAVDVVKAVIDTIWDKPPVSDELAGDPPDHKHHNHSNGGGGEA